MYWSFFCNFRLAKSVDGSDKDSGGLAQQCLTSSWKYDFDKNWEKVIKIDIFRTEDHWRKDADKFEMKDFWLLAKPFLR